MLPVCGPYLYAFSWSHPSSVLCLCSFSHRNHLAPWPLCKFLHMTERGRPTKSPKQMERGSLLASPSHSKGVDSCKDHCSATSAVGSCQPHHENRGRPVEGTAPQKWDMHHKSMLLVAAYDCTLSCMSQKWHFGTVSWPLWHKTMSLVKCFPPKLRTR